MLLKRASSGNNSVWCCETFGLCPKLRPSCACFWVESFMSANRRLGWAHRVSIKISSMHAPLRGERSKCSLQGEITHVILNKEIKSDILSFQVCRNILFVWWAPGSSSGHVWEQFGCTGSYMLQGSWININPSSGLDVTWTRFKYMYVYLNYSDHVSSTLYINI